MENTKNELLRAGIDNYAKQDMSENPVLCIEAIGFIKACKIIMPESAKEFDEVIKAYLFLVMLSA